MGDAITTEAAFGSCTRTSEFGGSLYASLEAVPYFIVVLPFALRTSAHIASMRASQGCEHGSRHHTLLLMGAEVVLSWAVVFQFLRSGSRLGVVLPRGHLGYLYLPVGF